MKLYTRTGDKGTTSLIGGRVDKDDGRVEAYGTVDEVNSFIGQCVVLAQEHGQLQNRLQTIQHDLFDVGVDLATLAPKQLKVSSDKAKRLEGWIDELSDSTPAITYFILPGGTALAAALHVSRTVCRRAERAVVSLSKKHAINPEIMIYLNRLSDFLFAAARYSNHMNQVADIRYESQPARDPSKD